jgi:hypothetical protein
VPTPNGRNWQLIFSSGLASLDGVGIFLGFLIVMAIALFDMSHTKMYQFEWSVCLVFL